MDTESAHMHPNVAVLMPMVEGIINLLQPFAEAAIHDLREGKIIALYNNISKRKIGDPSVVTELGVDVKDFPDVFDPYYKTNWDGRNLKCTSITVRDDAGEPIALVCINFDTTVFEGITLQLDAFLRLKNSQALNPVEQYGENWRTQVSDFINDFTTRQNAALTALSKQQKAQLTKQLYAHGLFNYREAAQYIAKVLGVSRATIYNYLKEEDSENN